MKKLFLGALFAAVGGAGALAQSTDSSVFTAGAVVTHQMMQAAMGGKVDVAGGASTGETLTNPTITGGSVSVSTGIPALTAETTRAEAAEATNATAIAATASQAALTTLSGQVTANTAAIATLTGTGSGGAVTLGQVGAANGVAPLNSAGKLAASYITSTVTGLGNVQAKFVADPGREAQYFLTEGTGSTLNDSSGNATPCNATLPSSSSPTWGTDGSLVFSGSNSAINLPSCVADNTQTWEFVVGAAVITSTPGTALPAGGGAINDLLSASGGGTYQSFRFSTTFSGNSTGSTYGQGYGTKWFVVYQSNGNQQAYSGPGFDEGIHRLIVVNNKTNSTYAVYLDGAQLPLSTSQAQAVVANAQSGLTYILGGNFAGSALFVGRIYYFSASTTAFSVPQVLQDDDAMAATVKLKGAYLSPNYGPSGNNLFLLARGESVDLGYNSSNNLAPLTPFANDAAGYLASAYSGSIVTGLADGNANATSYPLSQVCLRELSAMSATGGIKVVIFHDHGNLQSVATALAGIGPSTYGGPGQYSIGADFPSPPLDTTSVVSSATYQEMDAEGQCAQSAKASGWWSIKADTEANGSSSASNNSTYNAVENPIYRSQWPNHFDAFWDLADDPRLGSNYAPSTSLDATGCVLDAGGSAGPVFQSDNNHPTTCGQQLLGHELAAVYADMIQRSSPEFKTVAASYSMTLPDMDAYLKTPGGGTLTLLPYDGLAPNVRIATITNTGSSAETIAGGNAYNGGAQDTLDNSGATANTYSLAAGATKRFLVEFQTGSDASPITMISVQN